MSHRQTIPLEFSTLPRLDVEASAIRLEVRPVEPGGQPRVELEAHHGSGEQSLVDVRRDGDLLVIRQRAEPGEWQWGPDLVRSMRLFVPRSVRARIHSNTGRIFIEGLEGCDLELHTVAGAVDLDDVRGRLRLSVDAGTVRGDHLGGTFEVRSQAGSVKLSIDALDAGVHHIRTAMGSVKVELASGLDVNVETATTLGSARSKYPTNPHAAATLRLEADLGSVRVREGRRVDDSRHGDWPDWRRLWQHAGPGSTTAPTASDAAPAPKPAIDEAALRQVLTLVQDGKLSASDAERLIRAMNG
jgi:hypothetical protein